MVDIISKSSGPRREDVQAKRIINQNWPTISRLADQISSGGYSRSRKALTESQKAPEPAQSGIHIVSDLGRTAEQEPVVRITANHRVIIMDVRSGKQLRFLGQIRFSNGQKYFSLATAENNYFATVDADTESMLADLDGVLIESDDIRDKFLQVIKSRLEI